MPTAVETERARVSLIQASSTLTTPSGDAEDYLEATQKRLIAAFVLCAAIEALYVGLYSTLWSDASHWVGRSSSVFMTLLCIALALFLARRPAERPLLATTAILFHLALGVSLAFAETCNLPSLEEPIGFISWNCVNILMLPLLVPAAPAVILRVALAIAFAGPVLLLGELPFRIEPLPSTAVLISLFLPPFLSAALAYVPSRVLFGLRQELGQARKLGAYELVEKLGGGGMGEVWKARHRLLVRPAAVKLIRPELLAKGGEGAERTIRRFEREAQATAALESPHTVELYDFGVASDGTFYCVMELLRGLDLETLVQRTGPLPPERAVHLLLQVCDSLDDAHRAGLVHRDIKPANLFVCCRAHRCDYVKVLDFGLVKAQSLGDAAPRTLGVTLEGQVQGTPAYLAPEAVVGDGEVDPRADLYSLGCVAYYLLTGEMVFRGTNPMQVAVAHVAEDPTPLSERTDATIPKALEDVVMACLRKSPDQRPQSASDLAQSLASVELAPAWNAARAEQWWREHLPELMAGPTDRPPPDPGAVTWPASDRIAVGPR